MPDDNVKSLNQSVAMRAALMHIMLLDDYIGAVLSKAEACGPGFLRESLIDYVETLQRELRHRVVGVAAQWCLFAAAGRQGRILHQPAV